MKILLLLLLVMGLCTGCGNRSGDTASRPTEEKTPGARQLVEDMTGKTAVDRGRQARDTLEHVSKTRDRDLQGILGKE